MKLSDWIKDRICRVLGWVDFECHGYADKIAEQLTAEGLNLDVDTFEIPRDEGVWTRCANCEKVYRIEYDAYGVERPMTLIVKSCESGGIYDIYVKCPFCGYRGDIV